MPVMNTQIVKYDLNVSLAQEFGPSATMIVELMDGFEEAPDLLQAHLVGAVIKRLKVVATASPRNNLTGREEYILDVSTDRGYHLGRVKFAMPFVTGWNGTEVKMSETYLQSEAEGHIEVALRQQLKVRINQRTPPLPRTLPNTKGQRDDIVIGDLFGRVDDFEQQKVSIQQSISEMMVRRRQEELLQRQMMDYAATERWAASVGQGGLYEQFFKAALPGIPGVVDPSTLVNPTKGIDVSSHRSRDVAKRSDESSRVDTATRGGSSAQDVAEMGEELNL